MHPQQPKPAVLMMGILCLLSIAFVSCNNSADTSKSTTDSTGTTADTASRMVAPPPLPDTTRKMDTMKMDTAKTRPIKITN